MARKSGEDRKTEIIASARDIIFDEGFGNFTIRRVASCIGISEAAIYRHFASKEELLLALLDTLFVPWRQALEDLLNSEETVAARLMGLVELHLHHLIERRLNPLLFFSEAICPENQNLLHKLRNNLEVLQTILLRIVREAVKRGELPERLDEKAAADCMVAILQSSVIKWTMQRQEAGLVEHSSRLMKFFLHQIIVEEN